MSVAIGGGAVLIFRGRICRGLESEGSRVWQLRSAEIVWYGEAIELSWCKSLRDLSFTISNSNFDISFAMLDRYGCRSEKGCTRR